MSKKLTEGLRFNDLENLVNNTFLIDTYKSKMGEDRDVAVLSFKVKDRLPALDFMEFIERGYGFVLDADISSGEESDGQYSVFVEIERNKNLASNINQIIEGLSRLTGVDSWRFRYHKDWKGKEFNIQNISETVPYTPEQYDQFLDEEKTSSIKQFLDASLYDDVVLEENILTIHRPFSDGVKFEIKALGDYKSILELKDCEVKVDDQALAETVYLNKIFGDYEIVKLGENFMIKKDSQAILLKIL
jgi:hypothetical protein